MYSALQIVDMSGIFASAACVEFLNAPSERGCLGPSADLRRQVA
jgi:hypothetical protein